MKWVVKRHALNALTQGKTRYPLYRRLGGPQGRSGQVRKISPPPGFDPRTVQPVASRYIDWAIAAQNLLKPYLKDLDILDKAQHGKNICLIVSKAAIRTEDCLGCEMCYFPSPSPEERICHSVYMCRAIVTKNYPFTEPRNRDNCAVSGDVSERKLH